VGWKRSAAVALLLFFDERFNQKKKQINSFLYLDPDALAAV
jgi:hypothetical protein